MKTLLCLSLLVLMIGMAGAREISESDLSDIRATVSHMQSLAKEQKAQLDTATDALASAQLDSAVAHDAAITLQRSIDQMRAWGEAQESQVKELTPKLAKAEKESSRRGNVIGILGAGLLLLASTYVMRLVPVPYSFALPFIAAPAGYFIARLII